ncbi:MAG: glycosyltransferase family 39 protein [Candidatus Promineifilaceae bacterium]|nr:glycosyltransferase family 39 protein [Candidatus Promineifilaceae bacterium]
MRPFNLINWLRDNLLLLIILTLALFVRLWGIDFGLPFSYHVDEPRFLHSAVSMLQNNSADPGWFYQPSLYVYLVTLVIAGYYGFARITNQFSSPADLFLSPYDFDGLITQPVQFLLARLLTIFLALLTIWLVYKMAHSWMNKVGALAAAAFLSLSIFHVTSSHFITTDVPVAFFIMLTLYFCGRLVESGAIGDYLIVGVAIGLAAGTKYSAYVLVIPALLAHLVAWKHKKTSLINMGLILMGATAVVTFLITTPYILIRTEKVLADIEYEWVHHKVRGHIGSEGNSGPWLITQLVTSSDRWLTALAIIGFFTALWRRNWPIILTFVFVLTYFASMASNLVRFERFLVPMIPALAIGTGYTFSVLYDWLIAHTSRLAAAVISLLLGLLLLVNAFHSVIIFDNLLADTDVRTVAREWIKDNIPEGALIARERFSPNLDGLPYQTNWMPSLTDNKVDWYREAGYDYLIFAEARYGRLWRDPQRYADLIKEYEALWEQLELVSSFEGPYVGRPEYKILVYRVDRS